MKLRKYKSSDCLVFAQLFYDTVHTINAEDYSQTQLDVWATGNVNISAWDKSFLEHNTLVAEENGIIVGFGDMDNSGYIDLLYVYKDYQRKGIATDIVTKLEQEASIENISSFSTYASITAKPFFENHGYRALHKNIVVREGVELINYYMKKNCKE